MRQNWIVLVVGLAAVTACGGGLAESGAAMLGGPVAQTSAGALEGSWADESAGVSVFRGVGVCETPGRRPALAASGSGGALGRYADGD